MHVTIAMLAYNLIRSCFSLFKADSSFVERDFTLSLHECSYIPCPEKKKNILMYRVRKKRVNGIPGLIVTNLGTIS